MGWVIAIVAGLATISAGGELMDQDPMRGGTLAVFIVSACFTALGGIMAYLEDR